MGKDVVYNVGGDYRTTIAELAQRIGKIMNVPVTMPRDDANSLPGAPNEVRVSIAKFENEFGKLSPTNPEVGLQQTVAWHEAVNNIVLGTSE